MENLYEELKKRKRYFSQLITDKPLGLYYACFIDDFLPKIIKEQNYRKYSKCNHILVKTSNENCGCIKCGLNDIVLNFKREALLPFAQNMYDYLKENNIKHLKGRITDVSCDMELARAIYLHIKLVHPEINDLLATKYFEIALDNIRNIEVSEKRKEGRAKRLGLHPSFIRWNS